MEARIQPHSIEAEQQVLACCLVSPFALVQVAERLKPADFYRDGHALVFERICSMHRRGKPVDMVTLRDAFTPAELETVGGYGALLDLASSIPTTAHATHYAGIVAERAVRRTALRAHRESIEMLYDLDVEDAVTLGQGKVMAVDTVGLGDHVHDFGAVVEDAYAPIYDRATATTREPLVRAVETGLYDLDQLAWVESGDMIVLGARPSTGKTALALQLMLHVAGNLKKRVLFFSLEMSKEAIARRYLSQATGIGSFQMRSGHISHDQVGKLTNAMAAAAGYKFRIDDRVGLTVGQIAATAEREQITHGEQLGLIVVDHMLKVKPDRADRRHAEMTQICGDLKRLNRRLGVPVLALYQLNRGSEKDNREPGMADLRESGSVEEDADHIWLLHRPEREGSFSGAKLIVAKNRNGAVGSTELVFEAARTRFECQSFPTAGV